MRIDTDLLERHPPLRHSSLASYFFTHDSWGISYSCPAERRLSEDQISDLETPTTTKLQSKTTRTSTISTPNLQNVPIRVHTELN